MKLAAGAVFFTSLTEEHRGAYSVYTMQTKTMPRIRDEALPFNLDAIHLDL